MAYTNFKATVWSKQIQQALPLYSTLADDCNQQFKGEVGLGKTVKILGVAEPTIGDYVGENIGAPEVVSDKAQSLKIVDILCFRQHYRPVVYVKSEG